jgi:hypothetical protein
MVPLSRVKTHIRIQKRKKSRDKTRDKAMPVARSALITAQFHNGKATELFFDWSLHWLAHRVHTHAHHTALLETDCIRFQSIDLPDDRAARHRLRLHVFMKFCGAKA